MIIQQIKSTIRQTMAWTYHATKHFLRRLQGKVVILMYHRVLSEKELHQHFIQPGMNVRDDVFEKQMLFLKEHFQILSFAELLNFWSEKTWERAQRYCVITFDDGWQDNYIYAYPILRKYNIPATIFLPTALIGTNQWFWPDKMSYLLRHYHIANVTQEKKKSITFLWGRYPWMKDLNGGRRNEKIDSVIEICKKLPEEETYTFIEKISKALGLEFTDERVLLKWEEVEEMSQHGISFGSHSCTHKILTKLPLEESQKEIEHSLHILREKKTNYIPVFCYPNGSYTQEIVQQVKAAGYQAAVSTRFGFEDGIPQDPFCLKRISIHNDISATIPLFTFHISGLNHLLSFTS